MYDSIRKMSEVKYANSKAYDYVANMIEEFTTEVVDFDREDVNELYDNETLYAKFVAFAESASTYEGVYFGGYDEAVRSYVAAYRDMIVDVLRCEAIRRINQEYWADRNIDVD